MPRLGWAVAASLIFAPFAISSTFGQFPIGNGPPATLRLPPATDVYDVSAMDAPHPGFFAPPPPAHQQVNWMGQQEQRTLEERILMLEEAHSRQQEELQAADEVDYPTQKWTGRIHTDYWAFPGTDEGANFFERGDTELAPQDRFLFRRLRLGMAGNVTETMLYKIEFDFAEGNDVAIKDAYFGFDELPVLQTLLLGNQKRPYGLDHLNSSRYNVFLERPFIVESLNPDARRYGLQSYGVSDDLRYNWRYGGFLSTDIQDTGIYLAADDPGVHHYQAEFAGRFANTIWWDEVSDGRGYAHWAISGTLAGTDGSAGADSTARFRTRPEARTDARWIDTGTILGAETYNIVGLESVVNVGSLQVVSEFMRASVQRDGFEDVSFHGAYIYFAYFLTGEHMPWDRETGQLDRIVPFENFFLVRTCDGGTGSGWGAWQVALRLSYADFTDEDIRGGVAQSISPALNWWWTPYSRMQLAYSYGQIEDRYDQRIQSSTGLPGGAIGPTEGDYHIVGARFSIDF